MATDIFTGFESRHDLKRKRFFESSVNEQEAKRRNTARLPIRSPPPNRPFISITPALSPFGSTTGTLTPVDTSQDESRGDRDGVWSQSQRPHGDSQTSNARSHFSSSMKVRDDNLHENVDMAMSPPLRLRIGRARSNDILSPVRARSLNLLSPPASASADRIPTPVAERFGSRNPYESSFSRQTLPQLRTALSPVIGEEVWARNPGLPSPREDENSDSMMIVEDTSNGLGALTVHGQDDLMYEDSGHDRQPPRSGFDEHTSQCQDNGRTARLHMGYRSDCEKCVQRVPGHYSHILWS